MAEWLKLIPADEARRILMDVPPVRVENATIDHAAGRVLAVALVAPHDLPPARLSGMDGYAVRANDVAGASPQGQTVLRVIGQVPAGSTFGSTLGPGEAVSIATGGIVPDGADAVVMVEFATPVGAPGDYAQPGGQVQISKPVSPGANMVQAGEDLRAGVEVLPIGRRLRAGDLAALVACGVVDVPVFRRPRIAVLATGSEICAAHETPRPGQVRDSNQYVLAAEIESAGALAVPSGIVADDADLLRTTVLRLVAENDGLVLSGGSSVGPRDLTGRVLQALDPPGVLFHGIDIRPGKPTVFARAGEKPVVGMPGYPTSSMVVFEAFVRPMLARLGGENVADTWPAGVRARLSRPYSKPVSREDYLRVRLSNRGNRDGEIWADVLSGGSAAISNVIFSDGLAQIPAGVGALDEGTIVRVRQFR
jgi:molybdopterin molybdotransferase